MAPKIPFVGKRHMPIAFLLSASAPSHRERPVSRDASSLLAPQPFPPGPRPPPRHTCGLTAPLIASSTESLAGQQVFADRAQEAGALPNTSLPLPPPSPSSHRLPVLKITQSFQILALPGVTTFPNPAPPHKLPTGPPGTRLDGASGMSHGHGNRVKDSHVAGHFF